MITLADIQRRVGVTADGVLGPQTLAAIAKALGMGRRDSTQLHDRAAFYDAVRRPVFGGKLEQGQVDGLEALLAAIGAAGWGLAWAAYGLATAAWETNRTMQPVREAYWLSEDWRRANLRYYPHYGRGYVQLTWSKNYERADKELGLGGALTLDLDMAMRPDIAARVLVAGMEEGWFTDKGLGDYLPQSGFAGEAAFRDARRIINGQDKAAEIAALALAFQDALQAGDWK